MKMCVAMTFLRPVRVIIESQPLSLYLYLSFVNIVRDTEKQ